MLISLAGYLESVRCDNVVEVVLETLLKVKSYIGVEITIRILVNFCYISRLWGIRNTSVKLHRASAFEKELELLAQNVFGYGSEVTGGLGVSADKGQQKYCSNKEGKQSEDDRLGDR